MPKKYASNGLKHFGSGDEMKRYKLGHFEGAILCKKILD